MIMYAFSKMTDVHKKQNNMGYTIAEIILHNNNMCQKLENDVELAAVNAGASPKFILKYGFNNEEMVLAMVKIDGLAIASASDKFRYNVPIIIATLTQNPAALQIIISESARNYID